MVARIQRVVGGLAVAAVLVACGSSSDEATPASTTIEATTSSSGEVPPTTANPPTTAKPKRPLPGPVVPSTPIAGKVSRWHDDLAAMTAVSCRRIVDEASTAKGETELDRALILLFWGAGEGCLGHTAEARTQLTRARTALAALSSSQLDKASPRCRPQELLSWAFFTFLDTDIPATCPPPPTSSSSSSTTRTSLSTTTTKKP